MPDRWEDEPRRRSRDYESPADRRIDDHILECRERYKIMNANIDRLQNKLDGMHRMLLGALGTTLTMLAVELVKIVLPVH